MSKLSGWVGRLNSPPVWNLYWKHLFICGPLHLIPVLCAQEKACGVYFWIATNRITYLVLLFFEIFIIIIMADTMASNEEDVESAIVCLSNYSKWSKSDSIFLFSTPNITNNRSILKEQNYTGRPVLLCTSGLLFLINMVDYGISKTRH